MMAHPQEKTISQLRKRISKLSEISEFLERVTATIWVCYIARWQHEGVGIRRFFAITGGLSHT